MLIIAVFKYSPVLAQIFLCARTKIACLEKVRTKCPYFSCSVATLHFQADSIVTVSNSSYGKVMFAYWVLGGCLPLGPGWCITHLGRHIYLPRDGHCSGRYASYWNTFLFSMRTELLASSHSCRWPLGVNGSFWGDISSGMFRYTRTWQSTSPSIGAEHQSRRLPVVGRRTDVSKRRHVFIFRVRPDDSADEKKDMQISMWKIYACSISLKKTVSRNLAMDNFKCTLWTFKQQLAFKMRTLFLELSASRSHCKRLCTGPFRDKTRNYFTATFTRTVFVSGTFDLFDIF